MQKYLWPLPKYQLSKNRDKCMDHFSANIHFKNFALVHDHSVKVQVAQCKNTPLHSKLHVQKYNQKNVLKASKVKVLNSQQNGPYQSYYISYKHIIITDT